MKNINEQIDRIKQLFTEERLHGNLVENDSDELLSEAKSIGEKNYNTYKKNYVFGGDGFTIYMNKNASKESFEKRSRLSSKPKRWRKNKENYKKSTPYFMVTWNNNSKPPSKGGKKISYKKDISKVLKNYFMKEKFILPQNFEQAVNLISSGVNYDTSEPERYVFVKVEGLEKPKQYQYEPTDKEIEDASNDELDKKIQTPDTEGNPDVATKVKTLRKGSKGESVKNLQTALGITADGDFGNKTYEALKQFQKDNGLSADGVAGPKTMAFISNMGSSDNSVVSTDDYGKSQEVATAKNQPKSEPDTEVEKGATKVKKGATKTGDFTKPLQKLGGSQKGYTYHLVGPKRAEKRDANGKVVATYIKESNFNKKALFESAYTFDINNSLTENWKWVEGKGGQGQTFSDNLSKKFDDAIAQIGGETPVDDTPTDKGDEDSKTSAAKGELENTEEKPEEKTEVPEGWDNYPCVTVYPDSKEKKYKDGTKSYTIGNVLFFSSGKCQDTNTKEVKSYECKNGKIFIEGEEWSYSGDGIEIPQVDLSKGGEEKPKGDKSSEGGNIYQQLSNNPTPKLIADTIKGADKWNDDEAIAQSAFAAIKDIKTYKNVTDILGEDVFQFIKGFMGTSPNYVSGKKIPTINNHLLSIFGSNEEYNKFKETGVDPTAGSVENNEDDNIDSI
jgi:hypothetical protein